MKKTTLILISILVLAIATTVIILSIEAHEENSMKARYEEAVSLAKNKEFDTARQLFSQLPADYQYEEKAWRTITVSDWIESIDEKSTSPFIGEWSASTSQGKWDLDIYVSATDSGGVGLNYSKSYTSTGGVHIGDFGDLYVYDDGVTAAYTNSGKSNSSHYKLKLVNQNTLEIYFDNELEVTLNKY